MAHLVEKTGCAKENITTGFAFRLSPVNGLPEVTYGTVSCEVESTGKKGGVVDDVKGFFGFGQKKDDQKPLEGTAQDAMESGSETESATLSESATSGASSPEASVEGKTGGETKKRTETVYIEFTVTMEGTPLMSAAELKQSKERYYHLLSHQVYLLTLSV